MLTLVCLLACDQPAPPAPIVAPPAAPLAAPIAPPMSARAAADAAFNTAMTAYETGGAEVSTAIPKALAAYQALPELDTDGLFHVALLQNAAGDPAGARKTCDRILAGHPDHLFALAAGGRAAVALKDTTAARSYYERLIAAWDKPHESLPEYEDHDRLLPVFQKEALAWLTAH